MTNYLITIVGPTAIGKTALSIAISKHFDAPIISSDSRQFYKEMTLGTAVPTQEELAQAPHHFIQDRSIFDDYNVGAFEKDAISKLRELFEKRNIVVMVGGSGLYVDAVLKGLDHFPDLDPQIRKGLGERLTQQGIEALQNDLKKTDPLSYSKIDIHNPQRLIRALEICIGTGKTYSSFLTAKAAKRDFIPIKIGLHAAREYVYKRIEQRVDLMMQAGLLEEVKKLYEHKNLNALQTVGYRELFKYIEEEWDLPFAVSEIKKNTRRFAKRQGTWFRKDGEIHWFAVPPKYDEIIQYIDTFMTNN